MLATKAKLFDNLARDGGACQTFKIWTYSAIKSCLSKDTPVGALYQSTEATTATTFEIVSDIRGDVRELRDKYGNTFARYDYDAYGNIRAEDIFATPLITEELAQTIATLQPLRYAGYAWDSEIGLYYCSQRYYDPTIGAFISKDPIKADGELSAYAYCAGDPVGRIDPSGLIFQRIAQGVRNTVSTVRNVVTSIFRIGTSTSTLSRNNPVQTFLPPAQQRFASLHGGSASGGRANAGMVLIPSFSLMNIAALNGGINWVRDIMCDICNFDINNVEWGQVIAGVALHATAGLITGLGVASGTAIGGFKGAVVGGGIAGAIARPFVKEANDRIWEGLMGNPEPKAFIPRTREKLSVDPLGAIDDWLLESAIGALQGIIRGWR